MHRMIIGYESGDHSGRSYRVQVTKMGHIIIMKRHIKTIPVTAEAYLRKEVNKNNASQVASRLNKLV